MVHRNQADRAKVINGLCVQRRFSRRKARIIDLEAHCSKYAQAKAPAPPHKTDLAAPALHFVLAICEANSDPLGRAERREGSTWLGQADVCALPGNTLPGTALLCGHR